MTNELTVRVERPVIPAMSWNEEEVQKNLDELLAAYTGRVYTSESIKDAKADRAAVNKWDKQLGDALRAAKKLYTDPLEAFGQRIKAMQAQCKQVSGAIDQQVKAVEQAEREEKASSLRLVYRDCIGELEPLISFDRLLVPQWLNKTFDLARASKELRLAVETRREELRLIRDTCGEDAEACTTEYLRAFSVNDALHEHQRRQDARAAQAEAEARRQAAERAKAAAPVAALPRKRNGRCGRKPGRPHRATPLSRLPADWIVRCCSSSHSPPHRPANGTSSGWSSPRRTSHGSSRGAAERGFRYGSVK